MKKIMIINVEQLNMSALFAEPNEKGSAEWRSADPVRDDAVNSFEVALPRKPIVLKEKKSCAPHHSGT